jgi:tetratricopeptide (TPR) repeat protein
MSDSAPSLIDRLKRARIVQVLVVYLGATWVVLQLVDTLVGLLSLPDWVGPVAVLLLVVGLVVVLATAWVQALPSTTEAEEAGRVPSDWQVAPGDAVTTLLSGKLPHLTWGRAILGGAVALSLLFGGAGLYVVATGGAGLIGPSEAGADEAAAGIAVLPFHITGGEDLDLWREGMVDVLSTNLDGMGGFRTIDSRTVMARWRERVEGDGTPDLETSLAVAGGTGARFGLVGNLVGTPGGVRLNADIYDLSSGEKITQSYVEGPADSVLSAVGHLSVELIRDLLASTGQQLIQTPRTAGITTTSLEALRHYLDGEAAFRKSDFPTAAASFERAVDADSTFAMAWRRLSDCYGWMENINSEVGGNASRRVLALAEDLPIRERTLMVAAERALDEGDLSAVSDLREIVSKYPDDPEAWFLLGEFYRHMGTPAGLSTEADELEVFEKAVDLDPSFTPYYIHLVESLVGAGRGQDAREALNTYEQLAPGTVSPHLPLGVALFGGDDAERASALAGLDTVSEDIIWRTFREMPWAGLDDPESAVEVARAAYGVTGFPQFLADIAALHLGLGQLREAASEVSDPAVDPFVKVTLATDLRGGVHVHRRGRRGVHGRRGDVPALGGAQSGSGCPLRGGGSGLPRPAARGHCRRHRSLVDHRAWGRSGRGAPKAGKRLSPSGRTLGLSGPVAPGGPHRGGITQARVGDPGGHGVGHRRGVRPGEGRHATRAARRPGRRPAGVCARRGDLRRCGRGASVRRPGERGFEPAGRLNPPERVAPTPPVRWRSARAGS